MVDEDGVQDALKDINQNVLNNKKRTDIDSIIDKILKFFEVHFNPLSLEVKNKIKELKNIDDTSKDSEEVNTLIDSFFSGLEGKIREEINKISSVKENIGLLSDSECQKELNRISATIVNEISDFYLQEANGLLVKLSNYGVMNNNVDYYILRSIYQKLLNTLRDHLMISITIIDNNNAENNKKMDEINEKTLNGGK